MAAAAATTVTATAAAVMHGPTLIGVASAGGSARDHVRSIARSRLPNSSESWEDDLESYSLNIS